MGIREKLSQSKVLGIGAAVLMVGVAVYIGYSNTKDMRPPGPALWYSVDDGKTWFADTAARVPPFKTAEGKEAVRAHVFTCGGGKTTFVGYLERMNPASRAEIEKYRAAGAMPDTPTAQRLFEGGAEVKLPGEAAWRKRADFPPEGPAVKCPDGSAERPTPLIVSD